MWTDFMIKTLVCGAREILVCDCALVVALEVLVYNCALDAVPEILVCDCALDAPPCRVLFPTAEAWT